MNVRFPFLKIVLLAGLFILNSNHHSNAQVTQRSASIVPIGWNSTSTTNSIRFAVLQEIPSGTVIYFTDWGWDNTVDAFNSSSMASGAEGQVVWTAGTSVPVGSVLLLRLIGSTAAPNNVSLQNLTTGTSLNGNISFTGYTLADPMVATGDGMFVLQKDGTSNEFFISGFNNSAGGTSVVDATGWNSIINLTAIDTYLPDGGGSLNAPVSGSSAIGMTTASGLINLDNVQYTGDITITDTATWKIRFMNIGNWTGDNTGTISSSIGTSFLVNGLLPVSLIYFNAVRNNKDIVLSWKTASESNTRNFIIERSFDGIRYSDAGSVPATGGAFETSYRFIDERTPISDRLYYRLRIEDADNSKDYSPIAIVKDESIDGLSLTVAPNPLRKEDKLRVRLVLPKNGLLTLQLTDMAGKVLRTEKRTGTKGNNIIEWTGMLSLADGIYLLHVSGNGQRQTLKMVK